MTSLPRRLVLPHADWVYSLSTDGKGTVLLSLTLLIGALSLAACSDDNGTNPPPPDPSRRGRPSRSALLHPE